VSLHIIGVGGNIRNREQPLTFVEPSLLNGVASEFIGMETSVQCI